MRNSAVRPLAIAALLSLAATAGAQTQPSMPMMMPSVAPIYIEGHGFSSVLNLVNELKVPLNVTVEAYSLGGAQTAALMLTMAPYSLQQLTMAAIFGGAVPPELGSIRVSPDHTAGLLGVLSLTHEGTNTSYFEEELAMPSMEGSSTYRGVADDAANGSPIAAITSLSSMSQKITVSCLLENNAAQQQTLELASNQTALVRPCAAGSSNAILDASGVENGASADGANQPRKAAGIVVTSDAMPGDFAVYGLVPHRSDANLFFTSVNFSDPKARQASDSVYVGIPVGPSVLLTEGSYAPEVSVTNFGLQPASVVLEAFSTVNGKTLPATLAGFPLAAGATKTVALADMAPSPGLTNGLLVHTDAPPGDVLSKLVSRGGPQLPVVEMLDKDEHGSHNAGGHPWSIAPGVTSTLLLFNGEPTPQKVNLRFGTAAGLWMKRYTLAPFETRAISINQLVEGPGLDDSGRALTAGALSGEFGWQADSTRVSGRVLESNPALGMARSFSCSQWFYACAFNLAPTPDFSVSVKPTPLE